MNEDSALALLRMLAEEDDMSVPRVAKRLALSVSELQRLLVPLGNDPRFDGLDLVEQRRAGDRILLRLTSRGRALCAGAHEASAPCEGAT